MKKILLFLFILGLITSLTSCSLSNSTNQSLVDATQNSTDFSEESKGTSQNSEKSGESTDTPIGCNSEEKLIYSYIDWLNGQISDDEFYSFFDYKGLIAYLLSEEGTVNDMAMGYQLAVSYLNHDIDDEQILRKINDSLVGGNRTDVVSANEVKMIMQSMFQKYHEQANQATPFERTIIQENMWQHKYKEKVDYSTYHIYSDNLYYNNNLDLPIVSLNIYYYCHDGIWYWFLINETV